MHPITKEKVEQLQSTGSTVRLIDIRSKEEHEAMHIPGILHIPADDLANTLETFDKSDTIVCVCNHGGNRSRNSTDLAAKAGFENAYFLEGGTAGWLGVE